MARHKKKHSFGPLPVDRPARTPGGGENANSSANAEPGTGSRRAPRDTTVMVRRVNGRFLLISLGVATVFALCVHGLHAFMVDRSAGHLLAQADASEAKQEYGEAARHVAQYLQFRPNDVDAIERLVGLLRRTANSQQVWNRILVALENALRLEPDRDEVRRQAVEVALRLRQFTDARAHLDVLLARPELADDPELLLSAARTELGLNRYKNAIIAYLKVIDRHPATVAGYAELAGLLSAWPDALPLRADLVDAARTWRNTSLLNHFPAKRGERSASAVADRLLAEMVDVGRPVRAAYVARASYRHGRSELGPAADDLRLALRDPEAMADSQVLNLAAVVELARGRAAAAQGNDAEAEELRKAARRYAEAGLTAQPPEPRLNMLLAELTLDARAGLNQTNAERTDAVAKAERYLRGGLEQVQAARTNLSPEQYEQAQRLVETEIQLRWSLVDLLVNRLAMAADTQAQTAARQTAERELTALRDSGCRTDLVQLLECRLLLQDGKWHAATEQLESIRVGLAGLPDLRKRADLMLAFCFGKVNNPDRQVEIFRQGVAADRLWVQGRLGLAEALATAGRVDEAITEYQAIAGMPAAALAAAKLILLRELRKPAGERNFAVLEQFLQRAEAAAAQAPQTAVVRAQILLARGDVAAAAASLEKATQRFSSDITLWQALIGLETGRDDVVPDQKIAKAEDLIREAEAKFGDRVEIRLAKVDVARLRGVETLRAEIERLSENTQAFSVADRMQLFQGLVQYANLAERPQLAAALWRKALTAQPDSLAAWLALAVIDIDNNNPAGVEAAITAIRNLEGPGGPNGNLVESSWRLRNIMADAALRRNADRLATALAGPRAELQAAAEARPYWFAPPKMLGALESLAGNSDIAYEQFQRAFQLGDHSRETVMGIVEYQRRQKRFDIADTLLQQVERENPGIISGDLARMAWQIALERGQVDTAIDWAKRLSGSSGVFQDRLAHAHLLFAKYRILSETEQQGETGNKLLEQAQTLYRQVVDDTPHQPEAWFAYIVHLWRVGETEQAKAAIEEAKTKLPDMPASTRLISLAQYYEIVQSPGEAAKYYRLAVEADPADARLRMNVADFFNRIGQLAEAEKHLEHLLDPKNQTPEFAVTWARRRRAYTTAARGRYEDVLRALRMLRNDAESGETAVADLRAQLSILSGRVSLRDRKDLIQILNQIDKRTPLSDQERLQLAALYSQSNQWAQAQPIYEALLQKDGANALYLSELLAAALKHEPADAQLAARLRPRLDRLRAVEPESIRTVVMSARFAKAFEKSEEAATALRKVADRATQDAGPGGASVTSEERIEVRIAAETAEELHLQPTAETLFRFFAEHVEQPNDALVLATYLGRRSRFDDALTVVETQAKQCLPDAVGVTAVNVISLGEAPAPQVERADRLLADALEAEPQSLRLVTALAGLRTIQGRFDEAETLYRRVIAESPENAAALNNLAWLLAVTNQKLDEAATLIDNAVRISGPVAALVDTRGMVDLARNLNDKAMADLQLAFEDTPTPNIGFHLALAYERLGRLEKAREAFTAARKQGLDLNQLHSSEHASYRTLVTRLGIQDGSL